MLQDNWGDGVKSYKLYAPGMTFPVAAPSTTLNSQIRNFGGMYKNGDQCSASNFNEVWFDTYCEKRGVSRPRKSICNSTSIHQGLDVRGGTSETCRQLKSGKRNNIKVVAVYAGKISRIGSYTVDLDTDDHGYFRYLHLNMNNLEVKKGQQVTPGQLIGYMDNDFGGDWTTWHLHFEHHVTLARKGTVPVPPYCDMVLAYERFTGKRADMFGGGQRCDGGASDGVPGASPAAPDVAAAPATTPGTTCPFEHSQHPRICIHSLLEVRQLLEASRLGRRACRDGRRAAVRIHRATIRSWIIGEGR